MVYKWPRYPPTARRPACRDFRLARLAAGGALARGGARPDVLFHPDLRRVGEWTALSESPLGREALVARQYPEFTAPGRTAGEPLGDRHISRRPLTFQPAPEEGIALAVGAATAVEADGAPSSRPGSSRRRSWRGAWSSSSPAGSCCCCTCSTRSQPAEPARPAGHGRRERGGSGACAREIQRVADLDVPVLLRGETGTGKELVARAIHDAGPRRGRALRRASTWAPSRPSLAAAELFGAARGAFTGAVREQRRATSSAPTAARCSSTRSARPRPRCR